MSGDEPAGRDRPPAENESSSDRAKPRAPEADVSPEGRTAGLEARIRLADERLAQVVAACRELQVENEAFRDETSRRLERQFLARRDRLLIASVGTLDKLDTAIEAAERGHAAEALTQGLVLVRSLLQRNLHEEGLDTIPVLGRPFNPAVAAIVGTERVDDATRHDLVVRVVQPCVRIEGRIVQQAEVIVGVLRPAAEQAPPAEAAAEAPLVEAPAEAPLVEAPLVEAPPAEALPAEAPVSVETMPLEAPAPPQPVAEPIPEARSETPPAFAPVQATAAAVPVTEPPAPPIPAEPPAPEPAATPPPTPEPVEAPPERPEPLAAPTVPPELPPPAAEVPTPPAPLVETPPILERPPVVEAPPAPVPVASPVPVAAPSVPPQPPARPAVPAEAVPHFEEEFPAPAPAQAPPPPPAPVPIATRPAAPPAPAPPVGAPAHAPLPVAPPPAVPAPIAAQPAPPSPAPRHAGGFGPYAALGVVGLLLLAGAVYLGRVPATPAARRPVAQPTARAAATAAPTPRPIPTAVPSPVAPEASALPPSPETAPTVEPTPTPRATPTVVPTTAPPSPRPLTATTAPSRTSEETLRAQRAAQRAAQLAGLLVQADTAMGDRRFDEAVGLYDQASKLDPASAPAREGRARAAAARDLARRKFVTTRTVVRTPGTSSDLTGFESSEVNLGKAPKDSGTLEFAVTPASPRPGDPVTVRVTLVNTGKKAFKISHMIVATTVNGERSSPAVTPLVDEVAARSKAVVCEFSDAWREGTTAWSAEVVLTTPRGETFKAQAVWR